MTELIQNELTPENLVKELDKILHDEATISKMKSDYKALKDCCSRKKVLPHVPPVRLSDSFRLTPCPEFDGEDDQCKNKRGD